MGNIYYLYIWTRDSNGAQVSIEKRTEADFDDARRAAMRAYNNGMHCNVISGGRLIYSL